MCSYLLTSVLTEAGDLAAAERVGAAGLARARDAGDLWNQAALLPRMADLDLRAGRTGDAAAHLREGLQLAVRTGSWIELLNGLYHCGDLCAATGRHAEALTLWAACAALGRHEGRHRSALACARREEQLRAGPAGARARPGAGGRGARRGDEPGHRRRVRPDAHRPRPAQPAAPGRDSSAPGNGSWSPWSPRAAPTPRSPPSCTSASARSAPTWTGSGTRPAAAAAPT